MNHFKMDVFNFQIVSKYFYFEEDFINAVLVCKKFIHLLERYRYNPIPVTSKRLFPYMETQHIYSKNDVELKEIKNFVVWYEVSFSHTKRFADLSYTFKNVRISIEDVESEHINTYNELTKLLQSNNVKNFNSRFMTSFDVLDSKPTQIVVPKFIKELDESAFSENSSLKSVILCEGLNTISQYCFNECDKLTSIELPSSVSIICCCAFLSCGFESLTIPSSIYSIEFGAFSDCYNLKEIKLSDNVKTISFITFENCQNLTKIVLPQKLLEIQEQAFNNCKKLEDIKIPQSVYIVGSNAFKNCFKIKELVFNRSCVIERGAFSKCTSLTRLIVPTVNGKVLNKISKKEVDVYEKFMYGFDVDVDKSSDDDDNEENIIENNEENSEVNNEDNEEIDNVESSDRDSLTNSQDNTDCFIVPDNEFILNAYSIDNCDQIRHIYGLDDVTKLENCCFQDMKSLEEIILGDKTLIGSGCFENCTSLSLLKLPNNNMKISFTPTINETSILDKFGYIYDEVIFGFEEDDTITKFDDIERCKYPVIINRQFSNHCTQKKIKIPPNVTTISDAFFYLSNFEEIDLGNVCKVGEGLFGPKLRSVTIPTTLTSIGKNIFTKCNDLKSVNLCGKKTFDGLVTYSQMQQLKRLHVKCTHLCVSLDLLDNFKNVQNLNITIEKPNFVQTNSFLELPINVVGIANNCFESFYNLKEIVLSSTLKTIEKNSFNDCISLEKVILPDGLESIKSNAFKCCGLTEIVIPQTVRYVGWYAFSECYKLKHVIYSTSTHQDTNIFYKCYSLSSVVIIETKKKNVHLAESTYNTCYRLREITIPNNVTGIGINSFFDCKSLSKILIGKSVERLDKSCFENCESLEQIEIPNSVTLIDNFAFKNCKKLKRVDFASSELKMSPTVFENTKNLTEINVGGVKLSTITFPVSYSVSKTFETNLMQCENVIFTKCDIEKYLKMYKENGENVGEVPNGVVEIEKNCFRNYKLVTMLKMPISLKIVNSCCFCDSVTVDNVIFANKESVVINAFAFGLH
ncbi:hypothetical protein EIN_072770 [Entamoeba invadens IP1]|uniref:Leucine rich repeat containing protein BspA family protein n=1 Tax=Entamoeba invadens IP1 TaxID=370355 RepID=L7FNE8_ENTIV|nr:hypothetical protein EIN_072770 [Entamoeba invadens IP1]ELP91690.1 hypothetical protein EIN_072770 [Entamoeba invadens IP1]|eukprot:XP_004258461.1 hypothetical protein EIN_072770 [Entamoeba invadens IP1]